MIRDRIVCGINNKSLQKMFLKDSSLTLASCEKKCWAEENARNRATEIGERAELVSPSLSYDAQRWIKVELGRSIMKSMRFEKHK